MDIFNKKGGLFIINDNSLPEAARKTEVKNALYVEVYEEFLGASENPKYKNLSVLERFNSLNNFATKWLQNKGYLDV